MKNYLSQKEVERLRKEYPKGTKIKCFYMNDFQSVPSGTIGKVRCVDDFGTIHMIWETGSSLGLIVGEDNFQVVERPNGKG